MSLVAACAEHRGSLVPSVFGDVMGLSLLTPGRSGSWHRGLQRVLWLGGRVGPSIAAGCILCVCVGVLAPTMSWVLFVHCRPDAGLRSFVCCLQLLLGELKAT